MCENNNNYSEIAEAYRNYRDNFYNNTSFLSSECECDEIVTVIEIVTGIVI